MDSVAIWIEPGETEDDCFFPESPDPELEDTICRICHDSGRQERLISPCHCRGSMGKVHKSCLERWLGSSHRECCELCHFVYRLKWTPRYNKWHSILVWLVEGADRKLMLADCFVLFLFTLLMATIITLCVSLSDACNTGGFVLKVLVDAGLVSLCTAGLLKYFVWVHFGVWYHFLKWQHWWLSGFMVTVLPYTVKSCSCQTPKEWELKF